MTDDEEEREPSELVKGASAVGGALAGTALTFAAGPFVGSASGALVVQVLMRVGSGIESRLLGPRQERRIGRAYDVAAKDAARRLKLGESVRGGWVL